MRFTAKTATLRKVVEILNRLKKDRINLDDFRINTQGLDVGDVLLKCAEAMDHEQKQIEAAQKGVRDQSKEISQGKAFKNPPQVTDG